MRLKNGKDCCTMLIRSIRTALALQASFLNCGVKSLTSPIKSPVTSRANTNAHSSLLRCFSISAYIAGSSRAVRISQIYPTPYAGSNRPSKNSQFMFMVNLFRNGFVTGISKPNRSGLTTPIGSDPSNPWRPDPDDDRIPVGPPDTVSMQRRWLVVIVRQPVLAFQAQLTKHFGHDRIWRATQRLCRDVQGLRQQIFNSFCVCVHAGSLHGLSFSVHSYFPTRIFTNRPHCHGARSNRHA